MTTTIRDFGRHSERYGDIAYYYAFPIRFWFGQHMVTPEDVHSWCVENCKGFYKVVCYTHEDSTREKDGRVTNKVIYVDKIYLSSEEDAAMIKLTFDVRDQKVKRECKLSRKERSTTKAKVEAQEANKIAQTIKKDDVIILSAKAIKKITEAVIEADERQMGFDF